MPKLPQTIGKYRILDRVGRGGMSILYKAEHPSLGTPVVLKKLNLKGDAAHRERFRREAALMMMIRHDNVVGVYDHFREGAGHYLVMEYVDGRPLSELIAREGALPPADALWLAGRIATALVHIHSRGVIHRDLKPSNVLISRDGTVKIGDFGIAFSPADDRDITAQGTSLGTPTFMSPEQLEDARSADERSDLWSFGVCLFEMLTGRKFVTGPTPAAVREALPDAVAGMSGRLPQGLTPGVRRLLRRTLRMKKEKRLSDARAAVRLLGAARHPERPPESLARRLAELLGPADDGHDGERNPAVPAAPRPVEPPRTAGSARHTGTDPLGLADLFAGHPKSGVSDDQLQNGVSDNPPRRRPVPVVRRRLLFLAVPLTFLGVLGVVPGAWDAVFRPSGHGVFELRLTVPDGVPEFWLDGAEVRVYRDGDDLPTEVASPGLNYSRKDGALVSRRLSLPAGSYRLSWSLGDKVSWHSFRLPSRSELRESGGIPLVLEEIMGEPPVFPLELSWSVVDAISGADLSGLSRMEYERLDREGEGLVSGGRYSFRFLLDGYRSTEYSFAVSPWRRSLVIDAALWPVPAVLTIRNETPRAAGVRLNGSKYVLDLAERAPAVSRIGRIPSGAESALTLAPGVYELSPVGWKKLPVTVELVPGGRFAVRISGEGGVTRIEPAGP